MPSWQSVLFRMFLRYSLKPVIRRSTIEQLRAGIERRTTRWHAPEDVSIEPVDAGGVPAEWLYRRGAAQTPIIFYIHGGGWVMCSPETHRPLVLGLLRTSGGRALVIDYRLAPEHPFPAALEDCLTAYDWLLKSGVSPAEVVMAGDSAGGNLTLSTLLALRDRDPAQLPAAAVCLSPATDLTGQSPTYRQKAAADPLLSPESGSEWVEAYLAGHSVQDPLVSPVLGDLRGLPPMLIHAGEDEMLLGDAECLASRASTAGVSVRLRIWPGMWHVFHFFAPFLPEANAALAEAGTFVREQTARRNLPANGWG